MRSQRGVGRSVYLETTTLAAVSYFDARPTTCSSSTTASYSVLLDMASPYNFRMLSRQPQQAQIWRVHSQPFGSPSQPDGAGRIRDQSLLNLHSIEVIFEMMLFIVGCHRWRSLIRTFGVERQCFETYVLGPSATSQVY